ncbi:MAG: phenylalanine--tRNA ligase subunit alpha [Candidatus Omnitrophica bacterium]|nr:phenylalanine--tRNA ligase subunit alpha [Candidatus Omnitrophota bacterium]
MDINTLKTQIESEILQVNSTEELEAFRAKYLGRKGALAELTGMIPQLPVEQRSGLGQQVNALKNNLQALITERQNKLSGVSAQQNVLVNCDIGMPGIAQDLGRLHPITQIIEEINAVFVNMGFVVADGPEVETEFNNFTGLNIPLDHPSRDAFDTFYIKPLVRNSEIQATGDRRPATGGLLLRSHTSPVQVRAMKSRKPPLAVIVPGRVYRPDAVDASHLFMFHQIEGFMVDTNVTFSGLKGILETFAKEVFGEEIKMRFRPHFFPFTEPSAEVDISCIICKGKGCSVCGRKGWLEILGAGMIHPNVFKQVGYDPKKYSGFAFGMGIERIAMLKYGINDIRLFFENDLRFLKQF